MAKVLTEDQCKLLHLYYPPSDCCLCNARQRIFELEAELAKLQKATLALVSNTLSKA